MVRDGATGSDPRHPLFRSPDRNVDTPRSASVQAPRMASSRPHAAGGGVTLLGSTGNTINCEDCRDVDDQTVPSASTVVPCDTYTWDLSNAPSPGC